MLNSIVQTNLDSLSKTNYIELYLDWCNNYLTVAKFAADYSYTEEQACIIIEYGRQLNQAIPLLRLNINKGVIETGLNLKKGGENEY